MAIAGAERKIPGDPLPAWSVTASEIERLPVSPEWPSGISRDWALGKATGADVRVCVVDSGVDGSHPLIGGLESAVAVVAEDDQVRVEPDDDGDLAGHGTACAGIIRSLAPACTLSSVRVLGSDITGSGAALLAGLRWAIEREVELINLSISTTHKQLAAALHELADGAYFRRTVIVASAHNLPVESYPWRFPSVISVGSHDQDEPFTWYYNPRPPVEFFARGVNVEVAWPGGGRMRASGNSFATPHITGISALILSKHPELTPFQLKSALLLTASNVDDD